MSTNDLTPSLPTIDDEGDERTMLRQFLEYHRAVLERKASGLTAEQLNTPVASSNLTLGGLLLHMAGSRRAGSPTTSSTGLWVSRGPTSTGEANPDWELENVERFTPEQMVGYFRSACERSRRIEADAASLDVTTIKELPNGRQWSLRWIMVHMIEEYARHCGHADYIRQAIDGTVGD